MTEHAGHRQRMRERFREEGLTGFAPHEVLELLLFYGRARGNVNPLAHELLQTFGSLKGVLEASPQQLMAVHGIGEEMATLISLMVPMFRRYELCLCEGKKVIRTHADAADYCSALLAGQRNEQFYVICLSADQKVLGRRLIASGSLTEVAAYPRLVVETALYHNARSVILCHNHPSGSCLPSHDDISTTRNIQQILLSLDIVLLDHIVTGGTDSHSMVEHRDIQLIASSDSLIPRHGGSALVKENEGELAE